MDAGKLEIWHKLACGCQVSQPKDRDGFEVETIHFLCERRHKQGEFLSHDEHEGLLLPCA